MQKWQLVQQHGCLLRGLLQWVGCRWPRRQCPNLLQTTRPDQMRSSTSMSVESGFRWVILSTEHARDVPYCFKPSIPTLLLTFHLTKSQNFPFFFFFGKHNFSVFPNKTRVYLPYQTPSPLKIVQYCPKLTFLSILNWENVENVL